MHWYMALFLHRRTEEPCDYMGQPGIIPGTAREVGAGAAGV